MQSQAMQNKLFIFNSAKLEERVQLLGYTVDRFVNKSSVNKTRSTPLP